MSRTARALVILSTLAALAELAWFERRALPALPLLAALSFSVTLLAGRRLHAGASAIALLPVYLAPAGFTLFAGHNHYAYAVVWMAGVLGLILSSGMSDWSLPPRWRWALTAWAVVVSVGWPVVAWRELDFLSPIAFDGWTPVIAIRRTWFGLVSWVAYVAVGQTLGILWVDWLYSRYGSETRGRFTREIVAPFAAGIVIASGVGAYQGFVDVAFLSGHRWPTLQRAAGTLMDANVFGMLAALWAPAFVVLGLSASRRSSAVLSLMFMFMSWIGVWTSGSRTALLALLAGTAIALTDAVRSVRPGRARRGLLAGLASAAAIFVVFLLSVPALTATAFDRARPLLPALSAASVQQTLATLWNRDGYGQTAAAMIRDHPWAGVGPGAYHLLVRDYAAAQSRDLPIDNAQNWFRHQLVELGLVGSLGWITWVAVFFPTLVRPRNTTTPSLALRGPIVALTLASLVGMPGHVPEVALTFWLLLFWFARDAGIEGGQALDRRRMLPTLAVFLLAGAYAAAHASSQDLRPPFRAARFNREFAYGMFHDPDRTWSSAHGVAVVRATDSWMRLTVWVDHPDADHRPVNVRVSRDGERIVDRTLRRGARLTEYVPVPNGRFFVIEAEVDRTFRPSDYGTDDSRDLGLAMTWEFHPRRPAR
jgi:hypothetical protein